VFGFVQFEFPLLLGPPDGRFLVRSRPGADPERVLVLSTLGAPQRRLLGRRRGRRLTTAEIEPVATTRATVVNAEAFADRRAAEAWLARVRKGADEADAETRQALQIINRALLAHRSARADPYTWDVAAESALVVRLGFGSGDAVAEGRYADACEVPRERRHTKRSMEAPEERFAALLGAREAVLACEDLVLRARADLDAGRVRQAALQARVALESLLAELGADVPGARREGLFAARDPVGAAANEALRGEPTPEAATALGEAVERMEAALRAHRLGSAS